MTDHNREEREALIEAARRLLNDVNPKHRPALTSLMADDIRAVASSVFEQAHTPTDDKRDYDSDMAVMLSQLVEDEPMWSCVVIAKELHAAGFRRTVQGEPKVQHRFDTDNCVTGDCDCGLPVRGEPSDAEIEAARSAIQSQMITAPAPGIIRAALRAAAAVREKSHA